VAATSGGGTSGPISKFSTTTLKIGEGLPPLGDGVGSPSNTKNRLSPCQVSASSIQPFGHNKHGPKIWGVRPPFGEGATGSPSNTNSPGSRPSSIPSDILIHAAIWPQQIWAENWGLCPLKWGEMGPHLTQCGQGRGLPACQVSSWSVQPFGHSARMSQTGQTDNGPIA